MRKNYYFMFYAEGIPFYAKATSNSYLKIELVHSKLNDLGYIVNKRSIWHITSYQAKNHLLDVDLGEIK